MLLHGTLRGYAAGLATLLVLGAGAASCSLETAELGKQGQAQSLSFLSAEDFAEITTEAAWLCLQGEVEVDFQRPGQAVGFVFEAGPGDSVAAETLGDPGLDTVLMVFGPDDGEGFFGQYPVALDDDGGEGLLSHLRAYTLKEAGRYMLLASTFDGQSRGQVRLALEINGEHGCGGARVCPPGCDDGDPCSLSECVDGRCEVVGEAPFCEQGEVCCLFVSDGSSALLLHRPDRCAGEGGRPVEARFCMWPHPQECCLFEEEDGEHWSAPLPMELCAEQGGHPDNPGLCGDRNLQCCLFGDPEAPEGTAWLELQECMAEGGEPWDPEACWGNDEVCCRLPGPDGEPHAGWAAERACLEAGGEPVPADEVCELPPQEDICCLLPGPAGDRHTEPMHEPRCFEQGGEPLPLQECHEPEPEPEVCCLLPGPEGERHTEPMHEPQCFEQGGEPLPFEECHEPEPEPEVCCLLPGPEGERHTERMPEPMCADVGGDPLPPEDCEER